MNLEERADGALTAFLTYDTAIFRESSAHRLVAQFATVLYHCVAAPGDAMSALLSLSPAKSELGRGQWSANSSAERITTIQTEEARHILWHFNSVCEATPGDACIHHLVLAQSKRTPSTSAVEWHGSSLAYSRLVQCSGDTAA